MTLPDEAAAAASSKSAKRKIAWSAWLGLAGGVALVAIMALLYDLLPAINAVAAMGWGLVAVVGFHFVQMVFSAAAWQASSPWPKGGGFGFFFLLRLIREGVNNLLPVAQIGGEVVVARLLSHRGQRLSEAGASVKPVIQTNSILTLAISVLAGDVCSVLPGALVAAAPSPGELEALPLVAPERRTPVGFMYLAEVRASRALQAALQLAQDPAWLAHAARHSGAL